MSAQRYRYRPGITLDELRHELEREPHNCRISSRRIIVNGRGEDLVTIEKPAPTPSGIHKVVVPKMPGEDLSPSVVRRILERLGLTMEDIGRDPFEDE